MDAPLSESLSISQMFQERRFYIRTEGVKLMEIYGCVEQMPAVMLG